MGVGNVYQDVPVDASSGEFAVAVPEVIDRRALEDEEDKVHGTEERHYA